MLEDTDLCPSFAVSLFFLFFFRGRVQKLVCMVCGFKKLLKCNMQRFSYSFNCHNSFIIETYACLFNPDSIVYTYIAKLITGVTFRQVAKELVKKIGMFEKQLGINCVREQIGQ